MAAGAFYQAFVEVLPETAGFGNKLRGQVEPASAQAGTAGGKSFGSTFLKGMAGIAAGVAALGLGKKIANSIVSATDFSESGTAVTAIFGKADSDIQRFAANAAKNLGQSTNEVLAGARTFGVFGKAAGLGGKDLANFSTDFVTLATDLASFNNTTPQAAIEALGAGLRGESEPLRSYGILLDDATLKARALEMGIYSGTGTLTQQQKVLAAQGEIMAQTSLQQGDFAKTQDGLANQQRIFSASIENLSTRFGLMLLPAMTGLVTWANGNFIPFLSSAIDWIGGVSEVLATGNLSEEFAKAFNISEDSQFIGFLQDVRTNLSGFWDWVVGLDLGAKFGELWEGIAGGGGIDFSAVGEFFEGFMAIAKPAGPLISEVGAAVGGMSGEFGKLIGGALPLVTPILEGLTGVMGFLADNTGILAGVVIAIAAAWGLYQAAQAAANLAAVAALPLQLAQTSSNFALAAAIKAQTAAKVQDTAATALNTGATAAGTGSRLAAIGAWISNTAAIVASRVALVAGAVATGVATAAQWALNAAMSANPIALVVIAIAALVAGLIWFFTQTELGKEIWANFVGFLGEAWANIQRVATTVFTAVASFFTDVWNGIVQFVRQAVANVASFIYNTVVGIQRTWTSIWQAVSSFFSGIWNGIVAFVTAYINTVRTIIVTVVTAIRTTWTNIWNAVSSFFSGIWNGIVSFVTTYINTVRSVITNVVNSIRSTWNSIWNGISSFFSGIWSGIVSAVTGFVGQVRSKIDSALNFIRDLPGKALSFLGNLGNTLFNAGRDLIGGFINGIKDMIGGVGDAIGGVLDFAAGFFPRSPAERGPFSGAGWRQLRQSGAAIGEQFARGLAAVRPVVDFGLVSGVDPGFVTGTRPPDDPGAGGAGYAGGGRASVTFNNYAPLGQSQAQALTEFSNRAGGFEW